MPDLWDVEPDDLSVLLTKDIDDLNDRQLETIVKGYREQYKWVQANPGKQVQGSSKPRAKKATLSSDDWDNFEAPEENKNDN